MTTVDAVTLYRVGRQLVDLSRSATTAGGSSLGPVQVAVLEDVLHHPGTGIRELAARLGRAQSHVSTVVAGLRDSDLVSLGADPADGRRTVVTLTSRARRGIASRAHRRSDIVLAERLGSRRAAAQVQALVAELDVLLGPSDS
jgi:DNA-binding MarR family transcriptional regulator